VDERRRLYDFLVDELRQREEQYPHRLRPIRVLLAERREELLLFAEEVDIDIRSRRRMFAGAGRVGLLVQVPRREADRVRVKSAFVGNGDYTVIASVTDSTCTSIGLTNGILYYFVVSATNWNGESANSVPISVRPMSPVVPRLDFGFSNGTLQLLWPLDHTGWQLQQQTNSPQ